MTKLSGATGQEFFSPRREVRHVSVNDLRERMWWWPFTRGNDTYGIVAADKPVQRIAVLLHESREEHAQQIGRCRVIFLVTRLGKLQPVPQPRRLAVETDRQNPRARPPLRVFVITAITAQSVARRPPAPADGTHVEGVGWRRHQLSCKRLQARDEIVAHRVCKG